MAALHAIRVLDVGTRVSTAWCARLFAGYGAEVVSVEPADGHPLRRHPPFDASGNSIPARYVLAGQRKGDPEQLDGLVEQADVIVTSALPGEPLEPQAVVARNPKALVCAITPHGLTGSRAGLPGNELTANARSGWASVNGLQGREPLKGSGYQASYQAGTFAFGVAISALIEQLANDSAGQVIDVGESDVLVSTFSPAPLRYQYSGFIWAQKPGVDVNEGPVPVEDGWFALTISRPAFWIKAMRILGLPELADDKDLQQAGLRHKFKDRFVEPVANAMARWNRMELFEALGAQRVIAGPVLTMDEFASNPQFDARGFLQPAESNVRFPGSFARMSKSLWQVADGFAEGGVADTFRERQSIDVHPVRTDTQGKGPLSGFRGLVLTQAWAGTYATQLLGLLGADIIQLEVRGRLDSWRGTYQNPIPRKLTDRKEAIHPWNCSPLYNSVNLNKRCITLDLGDPQGIDVFKRLVAQVDFVAENFSPRVMGKLGIDYQTLTEIRPDLIMASMSAYGATGPWANVPGIGGTIEPSSGMSSLLGYPDEHPLNSGQMYPDPVAGLCGFAAIVLALLHRDRSGEGQYIDLSMQEANFAFVGDAWLEYAINGNVRGPLGNRHPGFAPQGIFRTAGEDQWIAIGVETDAQWSALCEILDIDATEFAENEFRLANEARLETWLGDAALAHDKWKLASTLSSRGVPAAAVLNPAEIADDVALRERGTMVEVEHPECGRAWQAGLAARLSRTPGGFTRHAPLQGQHSLEVFRQLIDMSDEEYAKLVEAEISGIGPSSTSTVENQA